MTRRRSSAGEAPPLPPTLRRDAWDVWTYGGFRVVRCNWCGDQLTMRETADMLWRQAEWSEEHEKTCSERLLRANRGQL